MGSSVDRGAFLDTNVLIYAHRAGPKGDVARGLPALGTGVLSVRVLNEFASVAHRKPHRSWLEIDEALADVVAALVAPPLPLTVRLHDSGGRWAAEHGLSFYDALIVAAALEAGCPTLWSEDLQDGRLFRPRAARRQRRSGSSRVRRVPPRPAHRQVSRDRR